MRLAIYAACAAILVLIATSSVAFASERTEIRSAPMDLSVSSSSWNPFNFAGFYYNVNKNLGTEVLTLTLTESNGSSAKLSDQQDPNGDGGVRYQTMAQVNNFEFEPWGSYSIIGFLGEGYFAAYSGSATSAMSEAGVDVPALHNKSESKNLMANSQLSSILIDDDVEKEITSDKTLELKEGYQLILKEIDPESKEVYLELRKNNQTVDNGSVRPSTSNSTISGQTYSYKTDLGEAIGIVIIAVHFKDAGQVDGVNRAVIDGTFQISDSPVSIESGKQFDKMRIAMVDPDMTAITMDNEGNPITLSRNMDISLMKDIHIKTADQSKADSEVPLRYYIYKEINCDCQDAA